MELAAEIGLQRCVAFWICIFIASQQSQIKGSYLMVKELRGLSGFGWDEDRKVVVASDEVWDEYIKVSHP